MRLFHKSPPPCPAPQRRVPRPWDPPQTEFPGIVPINTLQFDCSEQAVIAITGMSAYSNGFEIFVAALIGALWFTNLGNSSIGRITTTGKVTTCTAPGIKSPEGDHRRARRGAVVRQRHRHRPDHPAGTVTFYNGIGGSGITAGPTVRCGSPTP